MQGPAVAYSLFLVLGAIAVIHLTTLPSLVRLWTSDVGASSRLPPPATTNQFDWRIATALRVAVAIVRLPFLREASSTLRRRAMARLIVLLAGLGMGGLAAYSVLSSEPGSLRIQIYP